MTANRLQRWWNSPESGLIHRAKGPKPASRFMYSTNNDPMGEYVPPNWLTEYSVHIKSFYSVQRGLISPSQCKLIQFHVSPHTKVFSFFQKISAGPSFNHDQVHGTGRFGQKGRSKVAVGGGSSQTPTPLFKRVNFPLSLPVSLSSVLF